MNWDEYFLSICDAISKKSNCLSRKIGAILVRDNSILSEGYNGPPRGIPHCGERYFNDDLVRKELSEKGFLKEEYFNSDKIEEVFYASDLFVKTVDLQKCPRYTLGYKSGQGLHLCHAAHGERNALITAARFGIPTKGMKIYCSCGTPCGDCLIEIINAGIEEIIVTQLDFYDEKTKYLLEHSGIKIGTYNLKGE